MAFSSENDAGGPVANINVTPLVDVMLVLLVIFMVTTPMMQQGVEVNLPKTTAGALKGSDEQIVLSIDKTGAIFLGAENELQLDELATKVKAVMAAKKTQGDKVYVKADTELDYGRVMEVMGRLYAGGITQIGLMSAPVDHKAERKAADAKAAEQKDSKDSKKK